MARDARLLAALAAAALLCLTAAGSAAAKTVSSSGPLVEHWDGTAWAQSPGPTEPGILGAVTAVSPTDVWAVGGKVADHWDGSSWQAFTLPGQGAVDGVAAGSPTDVWAVGKQIKHWNGAAWTVVHRPPQRLSRLFGVSASAGNDAWAVGSYAIWHQRHPRFQKTPCCAYFTSKTFVLHWNGSIWKRVGSPNPSYTNPPGTRRLDELFGVAAASPRSVWAVGDYWRHARSGHRSLQTLVLHWNGRRWKHVPSPNPGGIGHANVLQSVTVAGRNDVWAVGGYHNGHGAEVPLTEHWNGRSWRVVPVPAADPFAQYQRLYSVSADAKGDVWAAGWYLHDNGTDFVALPLVEHWDGGSWASSPSAMPAYSEELLGIAALSPADVWAVGAYENP